MKIIDPVAKILENKIKEEAQKAIDKYIETTVLNSVLPHADSTLMDTIAIAADLQVELSDVQIDYTQMLGKSVQKSVTLENSVKSLLLNSVVKAAKPSLLSASETIAVNPLELNISTKIDGLGMKKTLMGAGAQIDAITLHLKICGNVSGKWQNKENANGN